MEAECRSSPITPSSKQVMMSAGNKLPFYDANTMLSISADLARGHIVLLSAGSYVPPEAKGSSKKKSKGILSSKKGNWFGTKSTRKDCSQTETDTPKSQTSLELTVRSESDITLGFLALTEGTVIDTCFSGLKSPSKRNAERDSNDRTSTSSAKKKLCVQAKSALSEASYTSEAIEPLAVDTYRMAFQEVLNFHQEVSRLNFFTFCFRYGKLQCKSQASLNRIFQQLEEAVLASAENE